jgi:hypothetical protein
MNFRLPLLIITTLVITSCKKETIKEVEVIKEVIAPVVPINKDSVLTTTSLKVDEMRFLQNNTVYYYKRGASGNSANFDTESIKFNSNNSGTYNAGGINYTFTWNWIDAAKTKLQYTVSYSPALTITWDQLQFTNNSVSYTESYNRNGSNSLGYGIRKH